MNNNLLYMRLAIASVCVAPLLTAVDALAAEPAPIDKKAAELPEGKKENPQSSPLNKDEKGGKEQENQKDGAVAPADQNGQQGEPVKDLKAAKEHFIKGSKLFEQQSFKEAAKEFIESYNLSLNPLLLFNIAKAYQEIDDLVNAEKYYKAFIEKVPDAQNVTEVETELKHVEQGLASRFGTISITNEGKNEHYNIYIDDSDEIACVTPCSLTLKLGEHSVAAEDTERKWGRRLYNVNIKTKNNPPVSISDSSAPPSGRLVLNIDDMKQIKSFKVGKLVGDLKARDMNGIPVGVHPLEIDAAHFRWKGNVMIARDRTTNVSLMLGQMEAVSSAQNSWQQIVSYVSLGMGAAFIGSGLYAGMMTVKTKHLLAAAATATYDVREKIAEQGLRERKYSNIFYGVGGGLIGVGVGFLIWHILDKPEVTNDVIFLPNQ